MKVYRADTMPGDTASRWGSRPGGGKGHGAPIGLKRVDGAVLKGGVKMSGRAEGKEGGGIHLLERHSGRSEKK